MSLKNYAHLFLDVLVFTECKRGAFLFFYDEKDLYNELIIFICENLA